MTPIIFLDFDGVVNTFIWREYPRNPNHPQGTFHCAFAFADDGFVNNFQAICWLNELYRHVEYDIVVSSTWRMGHKIDELRDILYNSGLSKDIEVIGTTPVRYKKRGLEIQEWIDSHNFTGKFCILDDDKDMEHLMPQLVWCQSNWGFGIDEYSKALEILIDK